MPFGLCNALVIFQRCIISIFFYLVKQCLEIFIDESSINGDSLEDCMAKLRKVLRRCQNKHLDLNWEKCYFMVNKGIVLGGIISSKRIL